MPKVMGGLIVLLLATALAVRGQTTPEYELPPISYSQSIPSNRVTVLQQNLDGGHLRLRAAEDLDTLRRCLEALQVPPASQVLVFSKTSLQRRRIDPQTPRALYFSEDCYVGWVPGGLMEIAVTDPLLGLVFYRLDLRNNARPLRFERDPDCLSCHAGSLTRQWPGLIVRSVFTDPSGQPITRAGSFLTDHSSPLSERWGGWYVTGQHGEARHMGNAFLPHETADFVLDRHSAANVQQLDSRFSSSRYLRPESDIVALMVLEHQITVHNRLAEGALRVRRWMHYQQALQKELGETVSSTPTGTALRVVQNETQRILEALLFVDEAPLPEGGIAGHADFQTAFLHNRRADRHNRSLKDFNLDTRLFQYRCSYLIHSEAFAQLPPSLKSSLYQALHSGLTAHDPQPPFNHLPAEERAVIGSILQATQPDWPRP